MRELWANGSDERDLAGGTVLISCPRGPVIATVDDFNIT